MKLLRVGPPGFERPAVLDEAGLLRDASAWAADWAGPSLDPREISRLALRDAGELPLIRHDDSLKFGPPVPRGGHLICIGLNYRDHADESGMSIPDEPIVFTKAPNTLVGPNHPILIPPGSAKTDWEVELAVIIGRRARYLNDPGEALEHVAGFATSNDVSEREYQLERGGQWVKGKSCESFSPLGPWLVTNDEVPLADGLRLSCKVNGQTMQDGCTSNLIFDVAHLVWYLSQYMVLDPGDVINTGTPAGVGLGRSPQQFLQSGDVVECEVEGLGTQRQVCVQATRDLGRIQTTSHADVADA